MKLAKGNIDWIIFLPVVGLLLFSIGLVYSASAPISAEKYGGVDALFIKQSIRVVLSIFALIFFSKIDYHIYDKLSKPIILSAVVLLVCVLIFGVDAKEARRQLDFGPIGFMPVEYAKFAVVLYFSCLLAKKQKVIKSFENGMLPFLIWIGLVCLLVALQPNFSNMALILLIAMAMLFVGNTNLIHLIFVGIIGCIGACGFALYADYRVARIKAFFGMIDTPMQVQQALIAIGNGGIFGLGPGQSKQAYRFLPEAHGDFIFSIIGEEYGFIGLLVIIAAFCIIFLRGMQVAKKAPDIFGYFISIGIVLTLAIYLLACAAVNTGLLPATGIPLPFLSYGGSAVIIYSAAVGILLNISAQAKVFVGNDNITAKNKSTTNPAS
ncbi:MAG: putative lipid II flippase FtsW [Ignavibacteria bacterium]|jgi:cell division protein FtsW|nr:putative lipid II flippase FtsW [Ignavibacteria bacterium]